ncbi:23S rRNA pseudouridine2605 synthase [Pseudorhizobium tarimense]|uniref:Pseudouridine synthase n=1 Tax=Pseudorhizobium tarimense TaxID=1079109 RepID=A0ABV2H1D4_9HYPH
MTSKDKPKRGGAKHFDRETKPKAGGKPGFSAKGGLKPRKNDDRDADSRPPRKVDANPTPAASADAPAKPERISKLLARAGVASRRDVERMIMEGRVRLNGQVLDTPVVNATLEDRIEVDGAPIRGIERTRLWLYHKPAGLVTTNSDPEGRPTVFDNLPEGLPRVLSIGRLDINTEGLLLLTNDGGLSRVLELPTTGWLRRYRVRAHGEIEQADLDKLRDGIAVDGVLYGAIEATLDRQQGRNVWLTMGLREGKNREIKNVLGALGLEVNRLIRISYGPFQLGDLPEGEVIEVRGRTLRDQLGPRLIDEAKANFDAPVYSEGAGDETPAPRAARADGKEKSGWAKDERSEPRREKRSDRPAKRSDDRSFGGKGQRAGSPREDWGFAEDKPKKRPPMGTSRTANVWMAPGARPTADGQARKSFARAEAERLFDKPKPQSERRVVVNRAEDDSDWIRAETPPESRSERGGDFGRKRSSGDRDAGRGRDGDRAGRSTGARSRREGFGGDRPRGDRKPREEGDRPRGKSFSGEGRPDRPRSDRPYSDRPSRGERPFSDKRRAARADGDRSRSEGARGERPAGDRPFGDRPRGKPTGGKPGGGKPSGGKPGGGRGKPSGGGGRPGGRPSGGKPRTPRG